MQAIIVLFLLIPLWCTGQTAFPTYLTAGTTLPITLSRGIDSRHAKPGDLVKAYTTQPIPMDQKTFIPAHATVTGQVTAVQPASKRNSGAALTFRFDRLIFAGHNIRIRVQTRAVASYVTVSDAKVPVGGDTKGDTTWTMRLIGGDVAYGQGPIVNHGQEVGKETLYGALITPEAVGSDTQGPLAFGEFSSHAEGTYGFQDLRLAPSGNLEDSCQLLSNHSDIKLPEGTEMLLAER